MQAIFCVFVLSSYYIQGFSVFYCVFLIAAIP
jgi:hypothetical protein